MDNIESQMAASGHLRRLAAVAVEQFQRGDLNAAKKTFGELEASSRAAGNGLRLQEALMYEGLILFQEGDLEGALEPFKNQELICRELGLRPFLVMSLGNQALVLAESGDWEKRRSALRLFEEVEGMCREEGDDRTLLRTLMNKGRFLYEVDFDRVRPRAVFKESVEIARKLEDKEMLALALLKEAECLGFDEVHQVRRLCEEARSCATEVGSEDLVRRIEQLLDLVRGFPKQAGQP
jgi:tetratricopeptide (TPR) repeat protein